MPTALITHIHAHRPSLVLHIMQATTSYFFLRDLIMLLVQLADFPNQRLKLSTMAEGAIDSDAEGIAPSRSHRSGDHSLETQLSRLCGTDPQPHT